MFARKVSVHLKADGASAFIQRMEDEIIPLLRKQKGFLDDVTLISQNGKKFTLRASGKTAMALNVRPHGLPGSHQASHWAD